MRQTVARAAAATILGLSAATSPARADLVPLTPTGPAGWEVSCRQLDGPANPNCNYAGTGWQAAQVVTVTPGGWATPADGVFYISLRSDASVGGVEGENPRYEYRFRTFFDLTGYDPGSASLFLTSLRIDNYWVGWSLNGSAVSAAGVSPTPVAPNGANWTTPFSLAITDGSLFQNGMNELELVITGNGRTDGLFASGYVTANATVPEPISMVLLGTGLAGLGIVARRRRREYVEG